MRHRPDRLFLLTGGVQGLAFSWGLPAMVWWVVDLRLSPFRLAVLGTALVLSILVTETPTGVVADLYSRKYSVVAAYVVMGSAMALTPVTELFGVLVTWQVLWGVGWTLQSGAATAWVTDEIAHHTSHSHRSAAVMPVEPQTAVADPGADDGGAADGDPGAGDSGAGGDAAGSDPSRQVDGLIVRHAVFRSVGVMVGLVAATAMGAWSVRGSMAVMGLLAIAAAGYLAVTMPEAGFESPRRRADGAPKPSRTSAWKDAFALWKRGAQLVRRSPSLLAVTLSAAVAAGAWEANDRLSVLRLFELGLTELDGQEAVLFFGATWFVMSALAIPMMTWLRRRLERSQADQRSARRDAFLLARFLTVAAAGALAMALSPWFAVALIGWAVLDVAGETAYSLTEAMANRHADSSVRATVVSFVGQAQAVGEVSIGLALGTVAQIVSVPFALAVAAALFAVSAAPAAIVGWRTAASED